MHISNLFKIAVRAIGANKLRSFLTMLGIIIGVGSVIAMIAIGQGSKQSIQKNISEMGSNMIMIHPGQDKGPGGARQDASEMQTLKLKDYELLKENTRYLSAISPSVNSSGQFVNGNNNTPSTIYGISPDYLEIRQLKVEDGEMFTEEDVKTSAKVCVIGKTIADNLFAVPHRRCVEVEGLQLLWHGPGRHRAGTIHHRHEAHPCRHLSSRHQCFCHHRGHDRPGH